MSAQICGVDRQEQRKLECVQAWSLTSPISRDLKKSFSPCQNENVNYDGIPSDNFLCMMIRRRFILNDNQIFTFSLSIEIRLWLPSRIFWACFCQTKKATGFPLENTHDLNWRQLSTYMKRVRGSSKWIPLIFNKIVCYNPFHLNFLAVNLCINLSWWTIFDPRGRTPFIQTLIYIL